MEFTEKELISIYSVLGMYIKLLNKKKNKTKNDILVLNKLKNINEKINKYMEEKENGISRKF